MTAYASVETAVEAMQFGAHNYIKKPFSSEETDCDARQAEEAATGNILATGEDVVLSSNNSDNISRTSQYRGKESTDARGFERSCERGGVEQ